MRNTRSLWIVSQHPQLLLKEWDTAGHRTPLPARTDEAAREQTQGPSIRSLASDQALKVKQASQVLSLFYAGKYKIPSRKREPKQTDCMGRDIKVVSSRVMMKWWSQQWAARNCEWEREARADWKGCRLTWREGSWAPLLVGQRNTEAATARPFAKALLAGHRPLPPTPNMGTLYNNT